VSAGLHQRPEVPEDVHRAILQAVEQVIAQERGSAAAPISNWRFSGRWFTGRPIKVRSRPH
jgi:hypothetical protein